MRLHWRGLAAAIGGAFLACDNSGPSGPSLHDPGAAVTGRYALQLEAAPSCGWAVGPLRFAVLAAPADTVRYAGVQVLSAEGSGPLEAELQNGGSRLRGGLGTTQDGSVSAEGLRVWVHAIATGAVQPTHEGRGQVVSGTLTGYLALGGLDDEEGALGICSAVDHSFSLRVR